MKNTQPHIERDQTQTRQLPKLQLLNLEQLEGVAGGPVDDPDEPNIITQQLKLEQLDRVAGGYGGGGVCPDCLE